MRGFLIFLGLLLVLAGGAVAAAQYAPVDLSMLDSVRGAKDFLLSPMALYAGGGAAGFGLLLIIIAAATGGKKKDKPASAKPVSAKPDKAKPDKAQSAPAKGQPTPAKAETAKVEKTIAPQPAPRKPSPVMAATPTPAPQPVAPPPKPVLQPVVAAPASAPPATASPPQPASAQTTPSPKPTASGQPPWTDPAVSQVQDPRLLNRKRVSDLVTINDAIKAYHAKHGTYPKAAGLSGFPERGAAWIPGLAPDFLKDLPRDPAMSGDKSGPQYVYVSDGTGYKLLAQDVSLIGGTNVEVLGVRIDPTREPTPENASFGFWTDSFASA